MILIICFSFYIGRDGNLGTAHSLSYYRYSHSQICMISNQNKDKTRMLIVECFRKRLHYFSILFTALLLCSLLAVHVTVTL